MLLLAMTAAGPLLVTARSAEVLIVAVEVALLLPELGSLMEDNALAVFASVDPFGTLAPTLKTSVSVVEAPEMSVAMLQLTEPVEPTLGFVQVNAEPVWETKVVPAGSASVIVTLCA